MASAHYNMRSRHGLSYLEVLIAAAVGLLGILGSISLYPLAFMYLQRGITADVSNAVGEAAIHQAHTIGLTNPKRWMFYDGTTNPTAGAWTAVELANPNLANTNYATVNSREYLQYGQRRWYVGNAAPTSSIHPLSSFCIDPRMIAEMQGSTFANNQTYWRFPYVPSTDNYATDVRMRRISLLNSTNNLPLQTAQAKLWFKTDDDLSFNRDLTDSYGKLPAEQRFIKNGANNYRRDYIGEYEWIVTLTPKLNGLPYNIPSTPPATNSNYVVNSGEYLMSIVVFSKRKPRLESIEVNAAGVAEFVEAERVCNVNNFLGNGIGGGDVEILTRTGYASDTYVRENDWVMLGGMMQQTLLDPNNNPVTVSHMPLFQWYRVSNAQGESVSDGNGQFKKIVTLEGADWPMRYPSDTTIQPPQNRGQLICPGGVQMTLVSGVVGVFQRTITLDSGDIW